MKRSLFVALVLIPTGFTVGQIPDDFPFDSLYVSVEEDTVRVVNQTYTYCSFNPRFEITVSNDTVTLVEIDESPGITTCHCAFSVQAKITNLNPGTYVLMIFRIVPVISDTSWFIGSMTSTVGAPPSGDIAVSGNRTGCGQIIQSARDDNAVRPLPFPLGVFPNPFNSTTVVTITLARGDKIRLSVADASGRVVVRLGEEVYSEGTHRRSWNAADFSSGTYFILAEGTGCFSVRKVLLIK